MHLLAEPTKLEKLQQEYDKKKEQFKSKVHENVLERYGGEEHLDAPPKSLLLAQTEEYIEYSRYGKIIKGKEKGVIRSRYEEDIFPNNHKSVWGSYWKGGRWGFKCCYSFIKNSYCLGESGKSVANDVETAVVSENVLKTSDASDESDSNSSDHKSVSESKKASKKKKKKKHKHKKKEKADKKKDEEKDTLKEALEKEELHQKEASRLLQMDERKRPYNSMYEAKKPTEDEMEAYLMKRKREEDPMADFL